MRPSETADVSAVDIGLSGWAYSFMKNNSISFDIDNDFSVL